MFDLLLGLDLENVSFVDEIILYEQNHQISYTRTHKHVHQRICKTINWRIYHLIKKKKKNISTTMMTMNMTWWHVVPDMNTMTANIQWTGWWLLLSRVWYYSYTHTHTWFQTCVCIYAQKSADQSVIYLGHRSSGCIYIFFFFFWPKSHSIYSIHFISKQLLFWWWWWLCMV